MTASAPAPMDVTSGCAGFSENVALHARPVSSGHVTVTDSSARATLIGPGRTPLRSSGTAAAVAVRGMRVRASKARKALRIGLRPLLLEERHRSLQLVENVHNTITRSRVRQSPRRVLFEVQHAAGDALACA